VEIAAAFEEEAGEGAAEVVEEDATAAEAVDAVVVDVEDVATMVRQLLAPLPMPSRKAKQETAGVVEGAAVAIGTRWCGLQLKVLQSETMKGFVIVHGALLLSASARWIKENWLSR
jgi:hypothetical protein